MPRVYGGAPKCPTCGRAVYFAEQVIGPQGSYHKACLKCVACGKLLEPRLLLDHDGQAYCKSCHGKAFGAKGYGAGGALVGEYAPRPSPTSSPTRPVAAAPPPAPPRPAQSPSPTRPAAARPVPSVPAPAPTPTRTETARRPLPTPPVAPPKPASIFASTPTAATRSPAPPPPPTPPRPAPDDATPTTTTFATPTKPSTPSFDSFSTRHTPLAVPPPPSTISPSPSLSSSGPTLCAICHTPAYAAESLSLPSLGGTLHRRCLRCEACAARLEVGRENVRDGKAWCKACYSKRWGVGGGLGGITRPNLF